MAAAELYTLVSVWLLAGLLFEAMVCMRQWRHLAREGGQARAARHGQRRALFDWLAGFERVVRIAFWLGAGALGAMYAGLAGHAGFGVLMFAGLFAAIDQLLCEIRQWARWWFVERAAGMSRKRAVSLAGDSARRVGVQVAMAVLAAVWLLWPFSIWAFALAWPISGVLAIAGMALWFWARPNLIAPLFERFTPLAAGELRQRLDAMMQHCGVSLDTVLVVDTSRRSRVANAYFTGLGAHKRVVLSDTLIDYLSAAELAAVMAHELGHYRCGHLQRFYASQAGLLLAGYLAIGWVAAAADLAVAPAVLVFGAYLLLPALGWPLKLWQSARRRRYEFEADAYAAEHADAAALITALEKLLANNLTAPTMDRWYAAVFATHPPGSARLDRLRAIHD
ncbi:M48 family peptidase [Salinisphaera sp. T5B8]|uniref:M48 family metalloprotease n=1 Tax=Salinisphaera sp. T5B8 TaxID=1304154 RepID=UPI00334224C6